MADFPEIIPFTKSWHTKPYPLISVERPELSVSGKNVVVTGGGTGIGKAIAIAFAQAGAKSVAILGRRLDRLESGATAISAASSGKAKVLYEVADLTDRAQVDSALDSIVSKAGEINIFVSSADVVGELGPIAGSKVPIRGVGIYNISKLASLKMVDQFAYENPGFQVINVHPGWVPTEMNGMQAEAPDAAELPGQVCVWLASAEARFLRGKFVWANWDAQELLQRADEIKNSRLHNMVLEGVPM